MADYSLSKKALEDLPGTVPIDEAAVPSATVRQEPEVDDTITQLHLDTITSTLNGKQIARNGNNQRLKHIDPPEPNAQRTIDVQFDNTNGILTFIKADGSELQITNLPTLLSLGRGVRGKRGIKGKPGKNGRDGKDGAQGYEGDQGPKGPDGNIGVSGLDGSPGNSGPEGHPGPRGQEGPTGNPGLAGRTGNAGSRGLGGCPGPAGPEGSKGDQGSGAVYVSTDPPGPTVYMWGYPLE